MSRTKPMRQGSSRSSARTELTEDNVAASRQEDSSRKRIASLYDAVSGKIGSNGFLTNEQIASSNILPSLPEEVLLRKTTAPDTIPYDFYNADEELPGNVQLPDSDLLKAIHTYTSDYIASTTADKGQTDFRTFDGTALLALGILIEEAARDTLGETGDMALVEPEGLEEGLPESKLAKYQVSGKVRPRRLQRREVNTRESDDLDNLDRLKRRRRT